MLTKIIKALADKFAKREDLNAAQRLIRSWCEPRPEYKPTRPHRVAYVVHTDAAHITREQVMVMRRRKQPPKGDGKEEQVLLRYRHLQDNSRKYPYASTRQNTRHAGGVEMALLAA